MAAIRPQETVDDSADARTFQTEAMSKFMGVASRPAQSVKPSNSIAESGPFDGRTTNKSDFRGYEGARPPAAIRPPRVEVSSSPFQGTSSYAAQFTGKLAQRVRSVKPDVIYEPTGKFTATSSNRCGAALIANTSLFFVSKPSCVVIMFGVLVEFFFLTVMTTAGGIRGLPSL